MSPSKYNLVRFAFRAFSELGQYRPTAYIHVRKKTKQAISLCVSDHCTFYSSQNVLQIFLAVSLDSKRSEAIY